MSSGNSPPADGPAVSVLVVEDHVDTLEALTRLLRASSFDVRSATNCASARVAAASTDAGPPDVVVGDIGLPDGNGADLLAELKARYGCRTIALSGWDESTSNDGVDRHLVKPVDLGALRTAIHEEASEPRD